MKEKARNWQLPHQLPAMLHHLITGFVVVAHSLWQTPFALSFFKRRCHIFQRYLASGTSQEQWHVRVSEAPGMARVAAVNKLVIAGQCSSRVADILLASEGESMAPTTKAKGQNCEIFFWENVKPMSPTENATRKSEINWMTLKFLFEYGILTDQTLTELLHRYLDNSYMKTLQQSYSCTRARLVSAPFSSKASVGSWAKACHTIVRDLDPNGTRTSSQHLAMQSYIKVSSTLPSASLFASTDTHSSICHFLALLLSLSTFAVSASLIFCLRSENNEYYQYE